MFALVCSVQTISNSVIPKNQVSKELLTFRPFEHKVRTHMKRMSNEANRINNRFREAVRLACQALQHFSADSSSPRRPPPLPTPPPTLPTPPPMSLTTVCTVPADVATSTTTSAATLPASVISATSSTTPAVPTSVLARTSYNDHYDVSIIPPPICAPHPSLSSSLASHASFSSSSHTSEDVPLRTSRRRGRNRGSRKRRRLGGQRGNVLTATGLLHFLFERKVRAPDQLKRGEGHPISLWLHDHLIPILRPSHHSTTTTTTTTTTATTTTPTAPSTTTRSTTTTTAPSTTTTSTTATP